MAKRRKPKFADVIYVTKENVGTDAECLYVWPNETGNECDGDLVATYYLKEIRRINVRTTTELADL